MGNENVLFNAQKVVEERIKVLEIKRTSLYDGLAEASKEHDSRKCEHLVGHIQDIDRYISNCYKIINDMVNIDSLVQSIFSFEYESDYEFNMGVSCLHDTMYKTMNTAKTDLKRFL